MNEKLNQLTESIKKGKRKDALALGKELVEVANPADILNALVTAMDYIGARFKANEIFVPEVLVSARAMKTVMEILEPKLVASGLMPTHCVVIGTVKGDLHDIGKNLVAMMLKGANFKIVDLGVDVTAEQYCQAAIENDADIIAISALLTTTMPSMKEVVDEAKSKGVKSKIIIGGAPVTDDFSNQIGSDGYSPDAASAVQLCKSLLKIAQ